MREIHLICDLQFGSTGKGLLAGYLAKRLEVDTVVTAWGPNAGHTFVSATGEKMVNIALPNGIVGPKLKRVLLGPGSVINPQLLQSEIERYGHWMQGVDLMIHDNAAVVQERHREQEAAGMVGIGSTMKGVGAAMIEKIQRKTADQITAGRVLVNTPLEGYVVDGRTYQDALDQAEKILIEGAQGYSLSVNYGMYPYTTSRDCTSLQIMSDCGIPKPSMRWPLSDLKVYGVARTYPIRVANRFEHHPCPCTRPLGVPPMPGCPSCGGTGDVKVQVGWSGPCYPDQHEIVWEAIGREPELTTVTRLPRRIFTFSMQQIKEAVRQNGVDMIFLNFCNYMVKPDVHNGTWLDLVRRIEKEVKVPVVWRGFGPTECDIVEAEQ